MSLYLSSLPLWIGTLIVVVLPTALAMVGPVIIRRRVGLERLATNNEIAGFKFATVGVIYAVLLAFAVIVVWERFSDADSAVLQEAGASATLYRLTPGAGPEVTAVRNALSNYLELVIEKDWPRMAGEAASDDVRKALDELYLAAIRMSSTSDGPSVAQIEIFKQLDVLTQSRRTRIQLAEGIVPSVLWLVLVSGAILTVGFTFFFGTQNLSAQVLMTGVLSTLVFMGLLVIISINHPFTGPVHIDSEPLARVLADFGHRT
ncbi:MAG: DUF4239 domain-containing protein [Proteobacteria bacterium]|nr:DUF4239 domain-containing protein [Pseudomonadota bacterium]